ncbi:DUF1062 domain-containing protein [Agrobacterium sp. NPDC089420]|uniref:DUF1062 domain-containing protein n=1 Tax=Agrobacterium sp. NPDC089420 TaxID=3363918 RepID=UPI003850A1D9
MPCAAPLSQLFSHPEHRHTVPARVFSCTILVDFQMEDQDDMCDTFRVRWTIIARTAPKPWIACSGCGGLRAFQCSGKIRLNANGRRLDAWLIYKCIICDKTWNRPIFERQAVRDISPAALAALQSNDPQWIRAQMFNMEALRRKSQHVEEFPAIDIEKAIMGDPPDKPRPDWRKAEIELVVPLTTSIRLDRLLASELGLSRSRLHALHDGGMVRTEFGGSNILRRRVITGSRIEIDVCAGFDPERLWQPAMTARTP